jgi:putative ABC transport system ATP-binding protein
VVLRDMLFSWRPATPVLRIDHWTVARGERVFVQGPSGSGKSTLLSLLAGVIKPNAGTLSVLGQAMASLSGPARDRLRADHIGFVFQQFNLLPYLDMLENVLLPCRLSKRRAQRVALQGGEKVVATGLLEALGLQANGKSRRDVSRLSVGQQQRVAVARALIGEPEIIICDEPTSSLDEDARDAFINVLFEQVKLTAATLIFVSHDARLGERFDRQVDLRALNLVQKYS